jgi:hypothetical protein
MILFDERPVCRSVTISPLIKYSGSRDIACIMFRENGAEYTGQVKVVHGPVFNWR